MRGKLAALVVAVLLIIGFTIGFYQFHKDNADIIGDGSSDSIDDLDKLNLNQGGFQTSSEQLRHAIQGNNRFAFDLYHELNSGKNLFYSPISISTALAMTYEGAGGQTAEEMRDVFDFPENRTELRNAYGYLHHRYNTNNKSYNMSLANSAWIQEDFPVLKNYKQVLMDYYFSKVANVDFIDERSKAVQMINDWVYQNTNGKIEKIVSESDINRYTRLILGNAIHFKARWAEAFSKNNTRNGTFQTNDGKSVEVPYMNQEGDFNYTSNDKFKILQKKYSGNEASMLFIMPKDGALEDVKDSITAENLQRWRKDLKSTSLDRVSIPKFNLSTEYSLKQPLKELGMPTAFTSKANLSRIDGSRSLYIQFVKHKAFIDVDEKGTEAAASTAVGIGRTSVGDQTTFIADHPFIFVIQDDVTGNILFMGRINDPTA